MLPKIALIDNRGKLFITDLTQKGDPTLYCIYHIQPEDIPNICRITYHDGICGIIYYNADTKLLPYGKYEEVYDNFSLITAAHLFKNLEAAPINQNYNPNTENKSEVIPQKNKYKHLRTDLSGIVKAPTAVEAPSSTSSHGAGKYLMYSFLTGIIALMFYHLYTSS